jgi:hypothetical protein
VSNFLSHYRDYVIESEPHQNYHLWCAIHAVSALLGRKCWIPQGHFTVYPNLYIVLVGDPGLRKSTAADVAANVVRSVDTVPMSADSVTKQALIDTLQESEMKATVMGKEITYHQVSAFIDELREFIGASYVNKENVQFLTTIWSRPEYQERTRRGGKINIPCPYFTMLACTTPSYINDSVQQNIISDGLARRIIFVFADELNKEVPWPELTDQQAVAWEQIMLEAVRINNLAGQFNFTEEALKVYKDWYIQNKKEIKDKSDKTKNYYGSKHVLILKVCMCLSAMYRDDLVVDLNVLQTTFDLFQETEKDLDTVLAGVGKNPLKPAMQKVLTTLEETPKGLSLSEIYKLLGDDLRLDEISEVLQVLQNMDLVRLKVGDSVEDPPSYQSKQVKQRRQVLPLLELVHQRLLSGGSSNLETVHASHTLQFDPITEKLLAQKEQRLSDLEQGLLLRGKPGRPHD